MNDNVRIPADIDREDRILAGFTARQVIVFAMTGVVLYAGWLLLHAVIPAAVYMILAVPVAVGVFVLVVVRRDGLTLDRLLLAGLRQRLQPRIRLAPGHAPEPVPSWLSVDQRQERALGEFELPVEGIAEAGVVDLGPDGLALIAACSTVNFALRTPDEQQALTAGFGRYLHSLNAKAQILVRAQRLDLSSQITDLYQRAPGLPHPALEAAALDHADFLDQLGQQADLLRRQVLLVLREPVPAAEQTATRSRRRSPSPGGDPTEAARRAVASRLLRRMSEATELLGPAGITVTPLDAAQASAVLATAMNPDTTVPPSPERAGPDELITTASADWKHDSDEGPR